MACARHWYARLTPGVNPGVTLQNVIDQCATYGGGRVVITPGDWPISHFPGVRVYDNTHIRFLPGAKLLRTGVCNSPLWGNRVNNVSITGANIDVLRDGNFRTCISFEHSRNITIRQSRLYSSIAPPYDDTIHAVLLQDCTGWLVEDVFTRYTQLKLGGGLGSSNGVCRRIVAEHARNYAIALVLSAVDGVIKNCVIEDVQVDGHCAGAIYLGNDHREEAGSFRAVRVQNVVARGPTSKAGRGVLLRLCRTTDDVELADIAVHHSYYPDFPGVADPWGIGIVIGTTNDGSGHGSNIRVRRIQQRGPAMLGMLAAGPIDGLHLEDVDLEVGPRFVAVSGSITGTETRCVLPPREELVRNGHSIDIRAV